MIRRRKEPIDPKRMRLTLAIAAALAIAAIGLFLSRPHENHFEREAHRITDAVLANDLSPVAADFAPAGLAKLTRASVADASTRWNALGKFTRLRETTPKGAPAGSHDFVAVFDRGEIPEHTTYALGGKITDFHYDGALAP